MEIAEQKILRLTIDYDNKQKSGILEAMDYLDNRFGEYNYNITRSGPKSTGLGTCGRAIGRLVVEVVQQIGCTDKER